VLWSINIALRGLANISPMMTAAFRCKKTVALR
jgi:hypothetical protein